MRFLTTLNKIEAELLRQIIKSQKRYLDGIAAKLASGQTLTPKTLEWKIKTATERLGMLRRDFKVYYSKEFDKTLDKFLKIGAKQIGMKTINFEAVPYQRFETLKRVGLEFMMNYADEVYKKVKSQLYVALLNGESYTDAWKRIRPIGNERTRPKVMVRDQMSRIAQQAVETSYMASGHPQDFLYYWTGPSDARTTSICSDRKKGNPYTYEQMKNMDSHPHIQCRHRWTAKPIDKPVEVKEEKPAKKDVIIKKNKTGFIGEMQPALRRNLFKKEDKIRNRKTEKAVAYDRNGNMIFEKSGSKNRVGFTAEEAKQMYDRCDTFTHNHPSSTPFSMKDFELANRLNIKRLRVSAKKFDYEIHSKTFLDYADEETVFAIEDLRRIYYQTEGSKITKRMQSFVNRKIEELGRLLTDEELNALTLRLSQINQHQFWKYLSKELGTFEYKRWIK